MASKQTVLYQARMRKNFSSQNVSHLYN
uniref:Uncharacterized protein n=1 Tax=Rhizophora mucronata TaxID=61149 RepID=A0A2P2IZH7_RHIMU